MSSAYLKVENRLITCPYDEAHRVKESRFQLHIAKCKLNHLDKDMVPCPFNATHCLERSELNYHLMTCDDKGPLDRKMTQSVNKNNPFKGRTDVPNYSEPPELLPEESWDEDISYGTPGYVPQGPPPSAIIEPRPMAKPSERRKFYKDLHKISNGTEKSEKNKELASPSQASKPLPIPRQPKQPSETQKLQNAKQQELNMQVVQNLGLGRGRPTNRIAANIFDHNNSVNSLSYSQAACNQVINGIHQLGLGRGQNSTQGCVPALDDDDDFPSLGCGRGAFRGPKKSPRAPGDKPK